MKQTIVVREYARLCLGAPPLGFTPSLDLAYISQTAFSYLCKLMAGFKSSGAQLCQLENQLTLRLDNYVGVLATPCGTVIEILPKITDARDQDALENTRRILTKMLTIALDLKPRIASAAELQTRQMPLQEWVMQQFILELDKLVVRGLRFDYKTVEAEQRYLQGQLDMAKQMRQSPAKRHLFHLRHDTFLPDNAENRLLKAALLKVCASTSNSTTWRDAHALASVCNEIPVSKNLAADWRAWRHTRLMHHYRAILPWCELVLGTSMPFALSGSTQGISLLFPMEKLFERYVEHHVRKSLHGTDFQLKSQAASHSLCVFDEQNMFMLKPDLLLKQGEQTCMVLDSKWKRVTAQDRANKFGLQQSDFYQLFAYGHKYLAGKGELILIYPQWQAFTGLLGPFRYSHELTLWVASFDLKSDTLTWPTHWQEKWGQLRVPTKPVFNPQ